MSKAILKQECLPDNSINVLFQEAKSAFEGKNLSKASALLTQCLKADYEHLPSLHLQGKVAFAQGDFKAAILAFRNYAQKEPLEATAHYDLAQALFRAGDLTLAAASYRKVLELQPDRYDAMLDLARILVKRKSFQESQILLQEILKVKPKHEEAEIELLRFHNAMGNVQKTIALGSSILERSDSQNQPAIHREIAKALRTQKEWYEAIPHFEAYVRSKPRDPSGHHDLGRALYFIKKYETAESELKEVLKLAPSRFNALLDLGRTLVGLNRQEEAKQFFLQYIKKTQNVAGYLELAKIVRQTDHCEEVIDLLNKALQHHPQEARLHRELAVLYQGVGQQQAALNAFNEALRYAGSDVNIIFDYARFQMRNGQPDDALKRLRAIAVEHPTRPNVHRTIAQCLVTLGRLTEAEETLRTRLFNAPKDIPSRIELGKLYNRQKRYEDAMACFNTILNDNPQNIDALHGMGVAYRRCGDTSKALESFTLALERNPVHVATHFQLAELAYLAGSSEDITRHTNIILEHNPTHINALLLRAQSAFEQGNMNEVSQDIDQILSIDSQHAKANLFRDLVRREISDNGTEFSLDFCIVNKTYADTEALKGLSNTSSLNELAMRVDWIEQILASKADWIVVVPDLLPSPEEVARLKNRIGLMVGAAVSRLDAPWEGPSIWAREPLATWLQIYNEPPTNWRICASDLAPRLRLRSLTDGNITLSSPARTLTVGGSKPVAWLVSSSGMNLFGGVERFLRNMVPIYRSMGYEPVIVGLLEKLDNVCLEGELDGLKFLNLNRRADAVREAGLRYRPRVVQCTTGVGYEVAHGLEGQATSIIYGSHFWRDMFVGTDSFENVDLNGRPRTEFRRLCANIDQGYANSVYTQEVVRTQFGIIQPIIYSLPFDEPLENISKEPGSYVLLMNGRPDKGFNLVRHLAKTLPDIPFKVVASQVSQERIEKILDQDGLHNVEIIGWTADTASLYRGARVVMVPSYAFVETFSRVTIEAHRFGVPVIGSDRGNVPFLLEEAGISLPEDPALWAAELRRLYIDHAYYEERQRLALENSERYRFSDQLSRVSRVVYSAESHIAVAVGSGIGNMIQCTPVIRRISEHFGRPVDVIMKQDFPDCGTLFAGSQYVGQVLEDLSLATKVNYRFVFVLDAFGDLIPRFNSDSTFITRRKFPFSMMRHMHESTFNLMCAEYFLGVPYNETKDAPNYFLGGFTHDHPKKGRIGLHAGGKDGIWMSKRWPYFVELAKILLDNGFEVISFGGKSEYIEGTKDFTGTVLSKSLHNINSCEYFIANDSGLMHVADALNIPLAAIFGPTSVVKNGPLSINSLTISIKKNCSPCQFDSDRFSTCRCIQELSLDEVYARIRTHMAQCNVKPAWAC